MTTTDFRAPEISERYGRYRLVWASQPATRTDAPDLMEYFRRTLDSLTMRGWSSDLDAETLAIHADLAKASFRTLEGL